MKAEIITIGDEILIGHTIDTNSAWIAKQLNLIGIKVAQVVTVSDEKEHIFQSLVNGQKNADVLILTGGLGPTKDDITKATLVEFTEDELVFNENVFEHIQQYFKIRGKELGEHNKGQAFVPSRCEVLHNQNGTAPGMWFEFEGKVLISLPGVPHEMKTIVQDHVLNKLSLKSTGLEIIHKHILTQGIGESALMELIVSWEDALPDPLKLAYLPSSGMVKLRISAEVKGPRGPLQEAIDDQVRLLEKYIGKYVVGYDDNSLQKTVGELLKKQGLFLTTAESCSGGYIAHLITSVAGSSDYFKGSVVAYHNEVKQRTLKVDKRLIDQHGAVSQEVVEAMVEGVLDLTGADVAVATSGIAGPLGGTAEKPVGTVWIAVGSKKQIVSKKFLFGKERGNNIERTAVSALNMLRKELQNNLAI